MRTMNKIVALSLVLAMAFSMMASAASFKDQATINEDLIDEINMIIEKYSLISAYVCIHCGQPQAKILNLGWIQPMCRKCFSEKHANDEKYDYDSLAADFPEMPEKIEYRKYKDKEIPRKTLEYEIVMIDVKETFDKIMAEWFS